MIERTVAFPEAALLLGEKTLRLEGPHEPSVDHPLHCFETFMRDRSTDRQTETKTDRDRERAIETERDRERDVERQVQYRQQS